MRGRETERVRENERGRENEMEIERENSSQFRGGSINGPFNRGRVGLRLIELL